jgi:hypothetical protein
MPYFQSTQTIEIEFYIISYALNARYEVFFTHLRSAKNSVDY